MISQNLALNSLLRTIRASAARQLRDREHHRHQPKHFTLHHGSRDAKTVPRQWLILTLLLILLFPQWSAALPMYAAQHRVTQCTACHFSPAGGGVRNLNGKMYGRRDYEYNPELKTLVGQDLISFDWRLLYYQSEKPANSSDGASIMESVVSASLPLYRGATDIRLNINQGFGGLLNDRDTYLQIRLSDGSQLGPVQYIQVGRLQPAFGLKTDEHRTYTHIVSQTSWNDFVMGLSFSSDPIESIHYDLTFVNGESTTNPNQLAPEKSKKWGGMLNLRWTSPTRRLPLVLGMSGLKLDRLQGGHASALAVYTIFSLSRATLGRLPIEISLEGVRSEKMNSNNVQLTRMIEANYLQSVSDARSQGVMAEIDWELSRRWMLTYKFDEMILDTNFIGDYYRRHGWGAKYFFGPNLYLMARYEIAHSTQSTDADRMKLANQNAVWTVMRASF